MNSESAAHSSATKCVFCKYDLQGPVKFCPRCGKEDLSTQLAQEAKAKHKAKAAQDAKEAQEAKASQKARAALEAQAAQQAKAAQEAITAQETKAAFEAQAALEAKTPPAAAPEQPANPHIAPKRSSLALKSALLLVVAAAVGASVFLMLNGEPDACELHLQQADSLLAAGNLAEAKAAATSALTACSDEAAKRRAALIESNVDRALAAQATCERSLQSVRRLVAERRLQSARSAVAQVREVCPSHAALVSLGHEIDAMLAEATGLSRSVLESLAQGKLRQAESTLELLTRTDQEFPAIPELRGLLQAAILQAQDQMPVLTPQPLPLPRQAAVPAPVTVQPGAQAPAAEPAPPAPAIAPPPARAAAPPPPPPVATAPPANQELVRTFLRDARQTMNQGQYDAALATARNALLIDPGSAEAQALVQQIRARQLEHTRRETRIE